MNGRKRAILALVCSLALALRVAYVFAIPDYDGDAYAHYEFASRTLVHPGDLTVHWVWLPGYHFFLAGAQWLGASFRDVRLINAVLFAAAPFLLDGYARLGQSRETSFNAARLWAVSSLGNTLATTALAEIPFTLVVLAACIAIDKAKTVRHACAAALCLTVACSMRYEAWFVVLVLAASWIVARLRDAPRLPFLVPAIPSAAIVLYIIVRRGVDHEWLWFVRETYRFTHMQRGLTVRSPVFELLWFPVTLPAILVGPAILFLPIGLRGWKSRPSALVPIALTAFLGLTYLGRGALGHARYMTVLMPFACLAIAQACPSVAARLGRSTKTVSAIALLSVLVTSMGWVGYVAQGALAKQTDLREREARADGLRDLRERVPRESRGLRPP